jgi:hypothetical protein
MFIRAFTCLLLWLLASSHVSAASIEAQRSAYGTVDRVVAVWSATEVMSGAWIGVFTPTASNTDYGSQNIRWAYLPSGATHGELALGPLPAGNYEFRLFKDSAYTVLARSAVFTVTTSNGPTFTPATSELYLPEITVNRGSKYTGVRLRVTGYSEVKFNDNRATYNDYITNGSVLMVTSLMMNGTELRNVYVGGLTFDILAATAASTIPSSGPLTPVQGLAKLAGTYSFTVNQSTSAQFTTNSVINVTITSAGRVQFSAGGFDIGYGDNTVATRVIGTPGSGNESYQLFSANNMQQISFSQANGSPKDITFTTLTTGFVVSGRR